MFYIVGRGRLFSDDQRISRSEYAIAPTRVGDTSVATGLCEGVCSREGEPLPYGGWGYIPTKRLQNKRRITSPMSDRSQREANEITAPDPISSHRRSGKKSQTAARVTGTSLAGQRLGRRLSHGRLFGSVFFAKKRNSGRYLVGYVSTNVVAVEVVRGRLFSGG